MGKLTVSYDGDKIINTSQSGEFMLTTSGKIMDDNVVIDFDSVGYSLDDIVSRNFSGDLVTSVTILSGNPFYNTAITSFSAPNATAIVDVPGGYNELSFRDSKSLREVYLPKLQTLQSRGDYAFAGCTSLVSIDLSSLVATGTGSFSGCTALPGIVLPSLSGIVYGQCFYNCSNMTYIDMFKPNFARTSTFQDCTKLSVVVLRSDAICPLSNINNFTGTPFASDGIGGTLYVPQTLIANYQAAANWSTILEYTNNQILPLEGSEYENTYADGTPIVQEETT